MIYPIIRPLLRVIGGTSGSSSRLASILAAVINGDDAVSGVPATGGGGGGSGPIIFGRVSLILGSA